MKLTHFSQEKAMPFKMKKSRYGRSFFIDLSSEGADTFNAFYKKLQNAEGGKRIMITHNQRISIHIKG